MAKFLTPEEMYQRKALKRKLTLTLSVLIVLGLIALVPVLIYSM
ncbi:hypothetical protein V1498_20710 [Peribacillus sp. SCS-26]